jgi:hypothetical protein
MKVRIVTDSPCEARVGQPSGRHVDPCRERSAVEVNFWDGATFATRLCRRHARELIERLEASLGQDEEGKDDARRWGVRLAEAIEFQSAPGADAGRNHHGP